jgi:nucleoside-diphosphate-sugar epimerase
MKIFITGANGFVGKNIINYFNSKFDFYTFSRNGKININQEIVIHLAGKAHDLKNISDPSEYYNVNAEFTKVIFEKFLESQAAIFITLSSVKATADQIDIPLTEDHIPNPKTHYGKSKLLSEDFILTKQIPEGKRFYILRPCMIHGPGNKGNLNLLYKIVSKGLPWPLGSFDNNRSFCSIENLCFIINELIENEQVPSGIYNIADDDPISTNELIRLIAESQGKKPFILNIPKLLVKVVSKFGDVFKLPLNTERLSKLTESYIVSNQKLKNAIKVSFPVTAKDGLLKTFNSFNNAK